MDNSISFKLTVEQGLFTLLLMQRYHWRKSKLTLFYRSYFRLNSGI